MVKRISPLLRPRVFALWVRDVEPSSRLEMPGVVMTADPAVMARGWPRLVSWLDTVPCIEFHSDEKRGWPFQTPGDGPWRISGCRELLRPAETTADGPDRIEATFAAAWVIASQRDFPRRAWELAADRTHGVLAVAIAAARRHALAIGAAAHFGPAGLACANRHHVSCVSRETPTKRSVYAH